MIARAHRIFRITAGFLLSILICGGIPQAQAVEIRAKTSFIVPLEGGVQGSAILVQEKDGRLLIVAGAGTPPEIGIFYLTEGQAPEPQPQPEPNPGPGPQPQPEPQPQPRGPYTLIWIEETAARTAEQARALSDSAIREALRKVGWNLRVADKDVVDEHGNPPTELRMYIDIAKQAGLPRLFVIDSLGTEVFAGAAPHNVEEFRSLLKRLGLSLAGEEPPSTKKPAQSPNTDAADAPGDTGQTTAAGSCPGGFCHPTQTSPMVRRRFGAFR